MSDNKSNQDIPSVEDLKKARQENHEFMKEQIEFLEVREKYTGLKAKIAENILIEAVSKAKLGQLQMKPEAEEKPSDNEG